MAFCCSFLGVSRLLESFYTRVYLNARATAISGSNRVSQLSPIQPHYYPLYWLIVISALMVISLGNQPPSNSLTYKVAFEKKVWGNWFARSETEPTVFGSLIFSATDCSCYCCIHHLSGSSNAHSPPSPPVPRWTPTMRMMGFQLKIRGPREE